VTRPALARRRLLTQRVTGAPFDDPAAAVAWLGAVQAQDYLGALWAIGLRTRGATEADVERAIAQRAIVRTWPMRGTLHFVAAADARWMLELLTPRAVAASAARLRGLRLDEAVFTRSKHLFERALRGGRTLARDAMYAVLEDGGIATGDQRGIHILSWLAQDRFLCFAARQGKAQTFALFEEWVPPALPRSREEALGELATRYFTGHGPATLADFTWWTKLTTADAREGLALAGPRLAREVVGGVAHWRSATPRAGRSAPAATALLPAFDESLVGYRDRSAILEPAWADRVHHLLSPTVVVADRVVGTWTRTLEQDAVLVEPTFFEQPGRAHRRAALAAAERYGAFLGRRVVVTPDRG
jgi:hypothetical protein